MVSMYPLSFRYILQLSRQMYVRFSRLSPAYSRSEKKEGLSNFQLVSFTLNKEADEEEKTYPRSIIVARVRADGHRKENIIFFFSPFRREQRANRRYT